jgi:cytochrome c-type biogenesis protein CcmH/NrfG
MPWPSVSMDGGTAPMTAMRITESFAQASGYFQAGQHQQAERLLRQLLAQHLAHVPALHLLGLLAYQNGVSAESAGA